MRRKHRAKERNIEYTESSGNVFADLGIPNPEETMAKAKIAMKICDTKSKKLTQAKAAKILKISQSKVSLLLKGYLIDLEERAVKKKHVDAGDEEFNKLLKEFLVKKAPMLKRLSKK